MTYKTAYWNSETNQQLERDCTPEEVAEIDLRKLPQPTPVPQAVSMRQASIALELAGLLDDVEAIVATLPRIYQIEWLRASTVQRNNPLVEMVRQQQGMTSEQIDTLFITAAAL